MAVKWKIESESTTAEKYKAELGKDEYYHRRAVVAEKLAQFPEAEWKEKTVVGGQFEAIAMQVNQTTFDKIAECDYRVWKRLVYKVCGV